jgi:hypothetical protein
MSRRKTPEGHEVPGVKGFRILSTPVKHGALRGR